ncbi:hypothetical protein C2G38_2138024 [Gigaspora rosea]|uniref:Uncharacterized protein n=1 Tax=Gigaspora rosea TaxID=44941 RepID=A0A397VYI9_9GLOM|nr:hypothetical protein C2G38_2138024 [Gigaspora rosea]
MKSLVNDGDKNRKQSSPLEIDEIKFILNSPAVAVDNPKGVSAYQHQSLKRKQNNVSLLIPLEEAEANSHEPVSCEPDSHKPDSCIALKDSTSNYINKGFSKASDLLSKVDAKAKVNNEPEADAKAKVDNELEAKASNKFKANDDESKAQSDDEANSSVKYKKAKIPNITIENCSNISINISLMP